MIRFSNGDMFESGADALVNTVNLVGVMGKGVALQFKERFKYNFQQYKHACENCKISIGNSLVVKEKLKNVDAEILVYEPGHKAVSVPRDAKLFPDKEAFREAYTKVLPLFRMR